MRLLPLVCCACFAVACGDRPPVPSPPTSPPATPLAIEHDFGIIAHGDRREHEFVLPLEQLGEPFVPLRVHLDCACGHADLRLRHREGRERLVDGTPTHSNLPAAEEQLILRIVIDTAQKEAVDLPLTLSRGFVVLQATKDPQGALRISWPIQLRFGIDAPVTLRPFSALDFGRVALSQHGETLTTLRGDDKHPDLQFGPVECSDPRLTVTLEPAAGHSLLRVRCQPDQLGNHFAPIWIGTSLPDYRVRIDARWKVVADLEATPMAKIAFITDLTAPQAESATASQFVLVTDHDVKRRSEFTVHTIVDADGRDASPHFVTTLVPMQGEPRQHRLFVRYAGGLTGPFRGTLQLSKGGATGPFLPIELVVFAKKHP